MDEEIPDGGPYTAQAFAVLTLNRYGGLRRWGALRARMASNR